MTMAVASIDKARRQTELLAVLKGEVIGSQEALKRALKRRGFPVTQATLSRDLKELRVPCVPTPEGYRYALPEDAETGAATAAPARERLHDVAALEALSISSNEVAVVIRTLTGRAQGVAVYLDSLKLEDLLATVAGDDTILAIPRSIKATERLRRELAALLRLD